ncbi:MAG: NADH:ubiquinone oxidoreductase [Bacteroidota bacterium]|nr:NADH:ubiquinone oxidoreductase [Bacteroidota bacterium]
MIDVLKILKNQGYQTINDVIGAKLHEKFRGLPVIKNIECKEECTKCMDACGTGAINLKPLTIDLGKCTFCPECEYICKIKKIDFTNNFNTYSNDRDALIINEKNQTDSLIIEEKIRKEIRSVLGRSLKLRQVSAGGCGGCELELNATGNVNFDISRFGIDFVASPRHADGLLITGPITKNMSKALEITFNAIPEPKIIILCGACSISGGIFDGSNAIDRKFTKNVRVDLYLPGCPPHPLTIINGILKLMHKQNFKNYINNAHS